MGDNVFWLSINGMIFGVIAAAIVGLAVCDINGANRVADLVKGGANPVDARCAIYGSSMDSKFDCNILLARQ